MGSVEVRVDTQNDVLTLSIGARGMDQQMARVCAAVSTRCTLHLSCTLLRCAVRYGILYFIVGHVRVDVIYGNFW